MNCHICKSDTTKQVGILSDRSIFHCCSCAVEFLHPQLNSAELNKLYTEDYYKAWELSDKANMPIVEKMKKATFNLYLKRILRYKSTGSILDIGCASGFFLKAAQNKGFQPYGIELNPFSAEIAKQAFGDEQIFKGIVEDCPFSPKMFDVIVMSDVLEHVLEPLNTLNKMRGLLKDDGIILITTPSLNSLSRIIMGRKWSNYKVEHLFYFSKKTVGALAQRTGFAIKSMGSSKKALTLKYIHSQFQAYPHWLLTPITRLLYSVLPESICTAPFFIGIGEMQVILKKA